MTVYVVSLNGADWSLLKPAIVNMPMAIGTGDNRADQHDVEKTLKSLGT